MSEFIIVASDNILEVDALTLGSDDSAVTTATVEGTLRFVSDDSTVTGASWPVTLSHVAAGVYRATLPDSLVLSHCDQLYCEMTADDGAGKYKEWTIYAMAIEGTLVADTIELGSDNLLSILGLALGTDATSYRNAATVEVTLTDIYDVELTGQPWPTTLAYEAVSDGKYTATLVDALNLTEGQIVKMFIEADDTANSGFIRQWNSILTVTAGA